MNVVRQIRQGDVLLHPITQIPAQAKRMAVKGRIVLAEGEATGHHHVVKTSRKVTAYQDDTRMYLDVHEPVQVEHEEHSALVLQPGVYEVRRQTEVWLDEVRQVRD